MSWRLRSLVFSAFQIADISDHAGAIAIGAMRLEILPIHFLRQLGYEAADETITSGRAMLAPTFSSEVQTKTAPLPPLCKGRWIGVAEPEGLFF